MLSLYLLTLCVQINRMFPLEDVMHLVAARTPPPKITRIGYGDIAGYGAAFVPTKLPEYAILSFESNRMHLFLHDHDLVYRCVWDGPVTFDDKKEIVSDMMTWWCSYPNHVQFDHRLTSHEDGVVFTDALHDLQEAHDLQEDLPVPLTSESSDKN